jgi:Protein tyrosine and serine/threonine kinase
MLISVACTMQVYKALSHGVQPVAVKIFPTHATPQQHAEFQREVVLLKSCRDGNIVQFLGASQTESQTLMITECVMFALTLSKIKRA